MQYLEINATGTYKLKASAGYLQGVQVNLPGAGTIQIFDNITNSAPAIAGATAFLLPAAGSFMNYDCHFSTGLTIVIASMSGGTITVSFY